MPADEVKCMKQSKHNKLNLPNIHISLHIHVSSLLPKNTILELPKQIVFQFQIRKKEQPDFYLIDLSEKENEPQ